MQPSRTTPLLSGFLSEPLKLNWGVLIDVDDERPVAVTVPACLSTVKVTSSIVVDVAVSCSRFLPTLSLPLILQSSAFPAVWVVNVSGKVWSALYVCS